MATSIFSDDFYSDIIDVKKENEIPMLYDYLIDLETGALVLDEKGQATIVSGYDAILSQTFGKINTVINTYLIYDNTYGSKIRRLIGKGKSYADMFIEQYLIECLVDKVYVNAIKNVHTKLKNGLYKVYFTMDTIYGNVPYAFDVEVED